MEQGAERGGRVSTAVRTRAASAPQVATASWRARPDADPTSSASLTPPSHQNHQQALKISSVGMDYMRVRGTESDSELESFAILSVCVQSNQTDRQPALLTAI